ncbi:MAG: DUF4214 domain-containing protein [Rhizobiaceae bacterium]|nr:DUF4214 domain-containing protein [Rhizobiaceae bacterium]
MPTYNFSGTIAEGEEYSVSQSVDSYDGTAMTVNGTAKAGSDYEPINLSLTGTGTFSYTLQTINDDIYEGNEVFYIDYDVDLVAGSFDDNVNGRITVTIDDEADRPTLSIETITVAEGDSDAVRYIKITASGKAAQDYTITLSATGGTAMEDSDYSLSSTPVVMQAMKTEVLVPITIFGDNTVEPNETINLRAVSSVAGVATSVFTILNDDEDGGSSGPVVTLTVDDGTAFEGTHTVLNYTVSESVPYAIDVTVDVPSQYGTQLADVTFRIPANTSSGSTVPLLLALTDAQREQIKAYGVTYSAVPVTGTETVSSGTAGNAVASLQVSVADELAYNLLNPGADQQSVAEARALMIAVAQDVFGPDAVHTSDASLEAADTAAGNAKLLVGLARAAEMLGLSEEGAAFYTALGTGLDSAQNDAERLELSAVAFAGLFNLVASADFSGPSGSGLGAEITTLDLSSLFLPSLTAAAPSGTATLAYASFEGAVQDALATQYIAGLPATGLQVTFTEVAGVEGANTFAASSADDLFLVDDAGDQTSEASGGGYDLVVASVDYTIGAEVEALKLVGEAVSGTGNGLDNLILGNELSNHLLGGDGDDTLAGGEGDDTFEAGSGDDVILGGEGTDTVVFNFERAALSVQLLPDGKVYVEEPDSGGTDILVDVERVDVTDGALLFGLDSENLSFAYRIYAAAYGRTPDEAGLLFWTNVLDQRGDGPPDVDDKEFVASFFLTANEFIDVYGENPTNEEYINKLYQNVLHREADQDGYDFWLGKIEEGEGRDDMLIYFTDSVENLQNTAPDFDNGVWVL